MWPAAYWPKTYWIGTYWPPVTGLVPTVPCQFPLTGSYVWFVDLSGVYNNPIVLQGLYNPPILVSGFFNPQRLLIGSYTPIISLIGGCMAVINTTVEMFVGEDKQFPTTIYQSDGVTLQDITGWHVQAVLHTFGYPDNILIIKDNGTNGGLVLTNPTQGLLTFTFNRADTLNLAPGTYQLRVERTDSGATDVLTFLSFTLMNI
jgi:hypothetical protein